MKNFQSVKYINLSISALGVFEKESSAFIKMLELLTSDKAHANILLGKLSTLL